MLRKSGEPTLSFLIGIEEVILKSVSALVEEILNPFLASKNLELYDLAFVKEGPHRYLRVFIDGDQGVSLEECELVSKFLSDALDKKDPIKEQYYLEVSSPGIERILKTDKHYRKYIGSKLQVNLFTTLEGQKQIQGKLISKEDEFIRVLDDCTKKEIDIPLALVSRAKNIVEF